MPAEDARRLSYAARRNEPEAEMLRGKEKEGRENVHSSRAVLAEFP